MTRTQWSGCNRKTEFEKIFIEKTSGLEASEFLCGLTKKFQIQLIRHNQLIPLQSNCCWQPPFIDKWRCHKPVKLDFNIGQIKPDLRDNSEPTDLLSCYITRRIPSLPCHPQVQCCTIFFYSNSGFLASYQYAGKSSTNKQCAPVDPVITVNKFSTWRCRCTYANHTLLLQLLHFFLLCSPSPFLVC